MTFRRALDLFRDSLSKLPFWYLISSFFSNSLLGTPRKSGVLFIEEFSHLFNAEKKEDIPNTKLIALLLKHPHDDFLYSVFIKTLEEMRQDRGAKSKPDDGIAISIYQLLNLIYQKDPKHLTEENINALVGIDLTQISLPNFQKLINEKLLSEEPLNVAGLLKPLYEEKAWANFVTEIMEHELITRLPLEKVEQLQDNLNKEGSKEKKAFERVTHTHRELLSDDIITLYIRGFPLPFYEKCVDNLTQSNLRRFTSGLFDISIVFIGTYYEDRKIKPKQMAALEAYFDDQRLSLISNALEPVYVADAFKQFLRSKIDIDQLGQEYKQDLAKVRDPRLLAEKKIKELYRTSAMNTQENASEITSCNLML